MPQILAVMPSYFVSRHQDDPITVQVPLFTHLRGRVILRTSPWTCSRNFALYSFREVPRIPFVGNWAKEGV